MPAKKTSPPQNVDDYLKAFPEETKFMLERLRKTIRSVVPNATEVISYQIPVFKLDGRPLVGFGSSSRSGKNPKNRCSFYLMSPVVVKAHSKELEPYDTAIGTVHFPIGKPLPVALVRKLVKARIAENEAAQRAKEKKNARK